jgi:hypothetical protein
MHFKQFVSKLTDDKSLIEAISNGYELLFETRNPKADYRVWMKQLEKYKEDPDVFISFTDINKLGINPGTDFNTPAGVYGYPLKAMYNMFTDTYFRTFADDREFIQVFRATNQGKYINDVKDYSSKDFDEDIKILKDKYGNELIDELIDIAIKESRIGAPIGKMWYVTLKLSEESSKSTIEWYNILSKVLGYGYIADKTGMGLIHPSEPYQGVFFKPSAYKTIDTIKNNRFKYDTERLKTPEQIKFAFENGYINKNEAGMFAVLVGDYDLIKHYLSIGAKLDEDDSDIVALYALHKNKDPKILDLVLSNIEIKDDLFYRMMSRIRDPKYLDIAIKHGLHTTMSDDSRIELMKEMYAYPIEIIKKLVELGFTTDDAGIEYLIRYNQFDKLKLMTDINKSHIERAIQINDYPLLLALINSREENKQYAIKYAIKHKMMRTVNKLIEDGIATPNQK